MRNIDYQPSEVLMRRIHGTVDSAGHPSVQNLTDSAAIGSLGDAPIAAMAARVEETDTGLIERLRAT